MRNENKSKIEKDTTIFKKLISKMSLEEKIGQMFQIGFTGTQITTEVEEMIKNYHLGSIIYFRRNIESLPQLSELSDELQKLSVNQGPGLPLIISIDQEGGIVNRIVGATHFPGNMILGATRNTELAKNIGQLIAKQLKALGINMDLAPVLDINNNPLNSIIGVRSFGDDPVLVSSLGIAFIEGMQKEGVIACGKHFPGHGDTAADSHLEIPVIAHSEKHLKKVEIYPFKQAIKAGVDSIMVNHIYYSALESQEGIPATLSSNILNNLLRKELGYKGLIVTDCMEMKAISNSFGTVDGCVMSIKAGSDIVIVSHTLEKQKAAIKAVIQEVKKGKISEERINQSVLRVLSLKKKRIGLSSFSISDYKKIDKKIEEKVALQVAKEGVTLVKDENNLIPINKSKLKKVLVLDLHLNRLSLSADEIKEKNLLSGYLKEEGLRVEYYSFDNSREGDIELSSLLKKINLVIVCSYDAIHHPYQVNTVKRLQFLNIPFIVLSVCNPYDFICFPEVPTFLTTYDYSPFNLQIASKVIVGKYKAQGILPVTLKF